MAQNLVPKLSNFSISLLLLALVAATEATELAETSRMSFFIHDYSEGPQATDVPVTGIPDKVWSLNQFGTINAFEDPITLTEDPKSAKLGRMQGVSVTSELNGHSAHETFAFVFTSTDYKGSTLLFQGINMGQYEKVREFPVISGTGKFRLARGFALFETYFSDPSKGYMVLRCNVTVLHHTYMNV